MKKLLYGLLFVLFSSNIGLMSTTVSYMIVFLYIFIFLLAMYITKKCKFTFFGILDCIPIVMFISWLYGFTNGFISGNEPTSVINNFFGMSLYLVYFCFLITKPDKNTIYKVIVLAALMNSIYALFYFTEYWFLGGAGQLGEVDKDGGLSAMFRSYYSIGVLITLPVLSTLFISKISNSQELLVRSMAGFKVGYYAPTFLFVFVLVGTTASKGFALCFMFMVCLLTAIYAFRSIIVKKKYFRSWYLVVFGTIGFILALTTTELGNKVQHSFSAKEASNSSRNEQRDYLVAEFSVLGAGLGGVLNSGYKRDDLGYGFELTYENLIHKLGVFALLPFLGLLYPFVLALFNILVGKNVFYSSVSFGLMLYLIPSSGNPMLFSPFCVIMHCVAIYFLRNGCNNS